MKAFELEHSQIVSIVGSLIADELNTRFRRNIDLLKKGALSQAARLRDSDFDLKDDEYAAAARRVSRYFGADPDLLVDRGSETIGDWAAALEITIRRQLTSFSFTPAGRDSETQACVHAADAVFADAAAVSNLLYGRRRLVSLVAPHSLMGFTLTVVSANLQQIPAIDGRALSPEELNKTLLFGDVVVATPSLWRYLLSQELKAPDNAMAVYFGEAMNATLAAELRKAGFGAHREIYGSTETGLIGWRDSPGESFRLFDSLSRSGDGLVRKQPSGDSATFLPMDIFAWESDRTFRLAGRRDGAVQIGAVNVFPDHIASVIQRHPEVTHCEIVSGKHQSGFDRLIAHIVLTNGAAPTETIARGIDSWCRLHLLPHERPRIYNFERERLTSS
jgi:4-coumarate--CoA ligase (photoactive yellow protein activation family)